MVDKKKEVPLEDDDWTLDFGTDDDDWGSWDPDGGEAPPEPSNREAAFALTKSAAKGASSVFLDPGRRQKLILNALPKEYTAAFESYDALSSEVRDVGREAREQLIKTSKEIKRQARSIYPTIGKYLPDGINNKINDLIKDDEYYGAYNQIDPKEAKIQSAQEQIFAMPTPPMPGEHVNPGEVKRDAQEAIVTKELKEAASQVRLENLTGHVVGIKNAANSLVGYQQTITTNYRKKMLEINYRQLFATQDLIDVTTKSMEKMVPNVERIVHNTALPDYAKEEFKEVYSAQMKRKVVEMFAPANFARDFTRVLSNNTKTAISSFFGTVNDQLQSGGQIAALMQGDDEYGGREKSPREKALEYGNMGANAAGEYLARRFVEPKVKTFLSKVREKAEGNETITQTGHKAKYWFQNLPNILNSYAKAGGNYDGAFSSFLNPIVGMLGGILPTTDGEQILTNNISEVLDKPTAWNNKDSHTLTEIIPGLLAKIDQSVRSGFMGSEQPLEQYDYKTSSFVTTKEIDNRIRTMVGNKESREYVAKEIDKIVDGIDKGLLGNGELSEEDRKHLAKIIDKKVRNGNHFDINDLSSFKFDAWEGELGSTDLMDKLGDAARTNKSAEYNSVINDTMRALREELRWSQQSIDAAQRQYGHGAVVRSGAFVANANNNLILNPELRSSYGTFNADLDIPEYGQWGNFQTQLNAGIPQVPVSPVVEEEEEEEEPTNRFAYKRRFTGKRRRKSARTSFRGNNDTIRQSLNAIGATAADKFTLQGVNFREAIKLGVSDSLYDKSNKDNLYAVIAAITESPISESRKDEALHPLIEAIREQLVTNNADERLDNIISILDEMSRMSAGIVSASDLFDETGKRIRSRLPDDLGGKFKRGGTKAFEYGKKGYGIGKGWLNKGWGKFKDGASYAKEKASDAWEWAVTDIPYINRTGLWSGIKDGVRGVMDIYDADGNLILSAKKLREHMYFNEAGKVILRIKDIDGNIYDKDGNIVISKEELAEKMQGLKYWAHGKWHAAGEMFSKGILNVAGFIGNIPAFVMRHTVDLVKKAYNKRRVSDDIYVKGEDSPRLRAMYMIKGMYVSVKTGKAIRDVFDIDGAVAMPNGNIVITEEELADPNFELVDKEGKPFKTFMGRLRDDAMKRTKMALNLAAIPLRKVKDGAVWAKDKALDAVDSFKSWAFKYTRKWGPDGLPYEEDTDGTVGDKEPRVPRSARAIVSRLDNIYELLKFKFSGGEVTSSWSNTATGETPASKVESPIVAKAKSEWENEAEKERADFKHMQTGWPFTSDESRGDEDAPVSNKAARKKRRDIEKHYYATKENIANRPQEESSEKPESFVSKTKNKASELADEIAKKLKRDTSTEREKKETWVTRLADRLKPKKSFDDTDGDGIRENSATDIRRKRAKQRAAEMKEKVAKATGRVGKRFGWIAPLLGGLGTLLGGLFKTVFGPLKLLGKGIEMLMDWTTMGKRAGALGTLARWGGKAVSGLGTAAKWGWNVLKSPFKAGAWAARGIGAMASSGVVTGAMSALGTAATTAGTAALGVISSPWVVGAAVVGGLGYLAYREATSVDVKPVNQIRYAQYGTTDYEDGKSDDIAKIRYLEAMLNKHVKYDRQGFSSLSGIGQKETDELIKGMGVDTEDRPRFEMFYNWLFNRAIPIYLLWTTRVQQNAPEQGLADILKLSAVEQAEIAKKSSLPANHAVYSVTMGPFEKGMATNAWESVKGVFGGTDAPGAELLTGSEVLEVYEDQMKALAEQASDEKRWKARAKKRGANWSKIDGFKEGKAKEDITVDTDGNGAKAKENVQGSGNVDNKNLYEGRDANGRRVKGRTYEDLKAMGITDEQIKKVENNSAIIRNASYLNAIDAIRVKTYGIGDLDIDKVESVYALESEVFKYIELKGGKAEFVGNLPDIINKVGPKFGVPDVEAPQFAKFIRWYKNRFLPVFLKFITEIKKREPGSDPLNVRVDGSSEYLIDVAKSIIATKYSSGWFSNELVWNYTISPFDGDKEPLANDPSICEVNLNFLRSTKKKKYALDQQEANKDDRTVDPEIAKQMASGKNSGKRTTTDKSNDSYTDSNGNTLDSLVNDIYKSRDDGSNHTDNTSEQWGGGVSNFNDAAVDANSAFGRIKLDGNSRAEVAKMISEVAKVTGVDETLLYTIAMLESTMRPNVGAGTSSAKGLYQFVDDTWAETLGKYGKKYGIPQNTSPYNAVANALMGAEYIRAGAKTVRAVSGKKHPTPVDMYMAHFLGPTGAGNFLTALKNDPDSLAAYDMPKAARSNPTIFYKNSRPQTYAQIYAGLVKRANAGYSQVARFATKPPSDASIATMRGGVVAPDKEAKAASVSRTDTSLKQVGSGDSVHQERARQATADAKAYANASAPAPLTPADTQVAKEQISTAKDEAVPAQTVSNAEEVKAVAQEAKAKAKAEKEKHYREEANANKAAAQEARELSRAHGDVAYQQLETQRNILGRLDTIIGMIKSNQENTIAQAKAVTSSQTSSPRATIKPQQLAVNVGR